VLLYIALACLNGMVVGTSRAINGGLSSDVGPLRASLWNHVVGFGLLTLILATLGAWQFDTSTSAPVTAYLGGFFGALFVAVNSYVFTRLGAMNAALLVISGQMISAVLIEYANDGVAPTPARWLGVVIVLLGVYFSRVPRSPRDKDKTP
jgi:bacterial/archaeal transporter family-2 protein